MLKEMVIAQYLKKFILIKKELLKFLLLWPKEKKIMIKEKLKKIEIGIEKKLEFSEKQVN